MRDAELTSPHATAETGRIAMLEAIEQRLRWLSSWTVHNANNLREKRDGLKVGGHQASCASITAVKSTFQYRPKLR